MTRPLGSAAAKTAVVSFAVAGLGLALLNPNWIDELKAQTYYVDDSHAAVLFDGGQVLRFTDIPFAPGFITVEIALVRGNGILELYAINGSTRIDLIAAGELNGQLANQGLNPAAADVNPTRQNPLAFEVPADLVGSNSFVLVAEFTDLDPSGNAYIVVDNIPSSIYVDGTDIDPFFGWDVNGDAFFINDIEDSGIVDPSFTSGFFRR
ncbi:MAG: hypothetical protein ACFCBW_08430 [Candidatus Competibacterales bacterium]